MPYLATKLWPICRPSRGVVSEMTVSDMFYTSEHRGFNCYAWFTGRWGRFRRVRIWFIGYLIFLESCITDLLVLMAWYSLVFLLPSAAHLGPRQWTVLPKWLCGSPNHMFPKLGLRTCSPVVWFTDILVSVVWFIGLQCHLEWFIDSMVPVA